MLLSHLPEDITGPKIEAAIDATGVPREELMLLVDRKTSHHFMSLTYFTPADNHTRVLGVRLQVLEPVAIIGQPKPDGYLELVRDVPIRKSSSKKLISRVSRRAGIYTLSIYNTNNEPYVIYKGEIPNKEFCLLLLKHIAWPGKTDRGLLADLLKDLV